MVLDEEALEAMLRRQVDPDAPKSPKAELTEAFNEFEVYERPKQEAEAPADAPLAPEPPAAPDAQAPMMEPPAPPSGPADAAARPPAPEVFRPSHAPMDAPAAADATPTPAAAPATEAPSHAAPPAPSSTSGQGPCRIAIVQCDFNHQLTDRMAAMAIARAQKDGAIVASHVHVPGVYDAPLMAKVLARRDDIDAVVVLGVVVKGDTMHDEVITHATAQKLQDIACDTEVPIGLGITGPGMSWAEAEARVGNAEHAVEAAIVQWQALRLA